MRILNTTLIIILFAFSTTITFGQQKGNGWVKRQFRSYFFDTSTAAQKSFRVYPTLGYAPETGVEIGASSLWLFRAKQDTLNRLSEVQAFTFFTFKGQYGLWIDNAIYGDQDKWFFLGRTRIQRFPLLYYGIGPNSPKDNPAVVDANYILLRQRVLRKLRPNLFIGPEVDYQLLSSVDFNQPDQGQHQHPTGHAGTSNLGLGAALVYDSRHNVLNVRKGFFAELSFLNYSSSVAADYSFRSVNLDIRSFHPAGRNNVLAWQVVGNSIGGEVPFNQMAQMGGDMMMRGYYQGRFRDKNLLATQVEYRLLPLSFSRRVGAVAFAGASTVAPTISAYRLSNTKLAAGAGVRYLLFPKKDIYLRLDFGFTKEGMGFYFYTGEAF